MKLKEKFNAKLLVEGNDDQRVVWPICEKYSVAETFDVIDNDGISEVLKRLPLDLKSEAIKVVGVILDTDQNLEQRWQNLKNSLSHYGYQLPDLPNPQGFIHGSNEIYPRIGIWLMPDNKTEPGMLEHFVERLIPNDDNLHPKVLQILTEIENENLNRYALIHHKKALIHTWLAWQKDPGTPMGLALTKTYLDHNTDLCLRFVNWLNLLFNPQ